MKKTIGIIIGGIWACIVILIVWHFFDNIRVFLFDCLNDALDGFNFSYMIKTMGVKGPVLIVITLVSFFLFRHIESKGYELTYELWPGKVKLTKWGITNTIAKIFFFLLLIPSVLALFIYILSFLIIISPLAIVICITFGPLYYIHKKL
jgi:hypothetical protein